MLVRGCMKIRDVMRPGPFTIYETDSLGHAQQTMTRSHIRHLPVVSDGKLVGMLSERDILAARAHVDPDEEWWALTVHDAMQSPVQTAGPDDSLTEVAGRMAVAKIGAMPVVERGKLLGLATVSDVLDAEVRSALGPTGAAQATAADVMTPWPFTVNPETPLAVAVGMMLHRHVRHLPVIDHACTLVGVLSERDVRTVIGDPVHYVEMKNRRTRPYRVGDVMTRPPIALPFDTPVVELAHRFADDRIGAIPVIDKFGALIGIVSYVDALRILAA